MSTAFAFHITMRLESGQVLAPTVAGRRAAARVIHEDGASRGLLAFRLADNHAHVLMAGSRRTAGSLAASIKRRLRWHLALTAPFRASHFAPIEQQSHLERAFGYILRQEQHHGIELDRRHDASSGPDLIGMRVLAPELAERVRSHLPRLRAPQIVAAMGLSFGEPDYDRLRDAAAAAVALPTLDGMLPGAVRARAAAVHAAPDLRTGELAERLGVTRRCIERLRLRSLEPALIRAVRLQLTARATTVLLDPGWDLGPSFGPNVMT
jgi:hypothetical protein